MPLTLEEKKRLKLGIALGDDRAVVTQLMTQTFDEYGLDLFPLPPHKQPTPLVARAEKVIFGQIRLYYEPQDLPTFQAKLNAAKQTLQALINAYAGPDQWHLYLTDIHDRNPGIAVGVFATKKTPRA